MSSGKIVIIGKPDGWHSQALQSAFSGRGVNIEFAMADDLQARLGNAPGVASGVNRLSDADLLLVREVPGGSLEQVIYRMDALHQLENSGVRLVNSPYAIEKMVDKYYALSLMENAGLRVPATILTENPSAAMDAFHTLGGDVVLKPLFGSRGVGMVRLTDAETAGRAFRALQLGGYVYYLQKFIEHDNRDLRVMVLGGECIAAMRRIADSWKTNIAVGARAEAFTLTDEVRAASLAAAHAVSADYCGVDLVQSAVGELFLLEVNSMPAWQGLQQVTSFNIADNIVDYCLKAIPEKINKPWTSADDVEKYPSYSE
jgi:RimK family alpha-L-glutamate ligase